MWNVNYRVVSPRKYSGGTKWVNVGAAFKREDNFSMVLDTYPIPNEKGEVWLYLYERMENDEVQKENEQEKEQKTVYKKSYGGTAK